MKDKCRAAVLGAARAKNPTRDLKDADFKRLDDMIHQKMRFLAGDDPAWQSYTRDQRLLLAAQAAKDEVLRLAARHKENAQKQAMKAAETETRLLEQEKRLGLTRAQSWADDLDQADSDVTAITKEYAGQLVEALEAAGSMQGAGPARRLGILTLGLDNPVMTRDIAAEIHEQGKPNALGKSVTGNALASKAAQVFIKVNEAMRLRRNAAGGDTGRLDYGYMPNRWDPDRIVRAGYDKFAESVLQRVDRKRYRRDDGSLMDDGEVLQYLRAAAETIATDGANTADPKARVGAGALANRGSEHRAIHWNSGEDYVAAMSEFGSGSMFDAMIGHVQSMAHDIALLERYGPNPTALHRQQVEMARGPNKNAPLVAWSGLDHHWAALVGSGASEWRYTPPVVGSLTGEFTGAGTARFWRTAREVEVFSKLGGAVLSSVTDAPTIAASLHFYKLPVLDHLVNTIRSMTPGLRASMVEYANTHGLIAETYIRTLNRLTGERIGTNWSAHLSNQTMKISLMNWWTDGHRRAFQLTMQQGIARWLSNGWDDLDEWTRQILLGSRGLTREDWDLMRAAPRTATEWGDLLTPDGIYATGNPRAAETVKRYMALMSHESTMAVLEPNIAAQAFLKRGTEAGSAMGEGARLIAQFQAFPTAMFMRHWKRILDTPRGLEGAPLMYQDFPFNRLAGIGLMLGSMTALGALAVQLKQMKDGKDPVDMTTPKFWTQAFLQGGGMGFLGSLMLNAPDERFSRGWEGTVGVLGPVAGSVGSFMDLTQGNLMEASQGKDTHAGAEALRFARSHAPMVNVWYLKAAIDHAFMHDLQEMASPGYLSRIKNKQRKDWGGEYWWEPGASFSEMSAPDLTAVAGR